MRYRLLTSQVKKGQNFFKKPVNSVLFLILIIGILLRVLGVYPGYNSYHPDEGKAGFSSAWFMFLNRTLDLPHYNYPAAIPLIELIAMILTYIPLMWAKFILTHFELVITHVNQLPDYFPNQVFGNPGSPQFYLPIMYWARYLTVIFSALTLLLVYKVSNLLFKSQKAAVLTTLLLAVNLKMVTYSQFDLPDTYNAFFLLLAFWILLKMRDYPNKKWYILSGVGMGISISTKLQVFSVFPFALIVLSQILRVKDSLQKKIVLLISDKFILGVFSLILTILLINWGPLNNWQEFYETILYEAMKYGVGNNTISAVSISYLYKIILTPAIFFAFVLGMVVGLKKKTFPAILVLSVLIPFLFYILYYTRGWVYPRNFVTITPFFILLAGFGLSYIGDKLDKLVLNSRVRNAIFLLVILLFVYESIKNTIIHTWSYSQPWSLVSMRSCLLKKVPQGATIASHPWDKHTLFSISALDVTKNLNFGVLNPEMRYSSSELRDEKVDFALVGLDILNDSNSNWWMATKKVNFWNKPIEISKNTFSSLAALELAQNTLCHAIKPWQAHDNNYFFSRIPSRLDVETDLKNSFDFSNQEETKRWKKIDGFINDEGDNLIFDSSIGHANSGSLKIKAATTDYPVVRWISPVFSVEPGKAYNAEAWLKAATDLTIKQREGFIRIDFYNLEPKTWDEKTLGLSVNLSSRHYGIVGWNQVGVMGIAPDGATLATVSFQVVNSSTTDYWLDDLTIKESRVKITNRNNENEYQLVIDDDVLVPNLGWGF